MISRIEYNLVAYCPLEFALSQVHKKLKYIECFGIILHDKDVYTSDVYVKKDDNSEAVLTHKKGDKEINHLHIFIRLKRQRELQDIKNWFITLDANNKKTNVLWKDTKATSKDAVLYLTHENDKDKYQYPVSELHSYNLNLDVLDDAPCDLTYNIMCDFLSGVDYLTLIKIYGKDFVYHYRNYRDIRDDMVIQGQYRYNRVVNSDELDDSQDLPF